MTLPDDSKTITEIMVHGIVNTFRKVVLFCLDHLFIIWLLTVVVSFFCCWITFYG